MLPLREILEVSDSVLSTLGISLNLLLLYLIIYKTSKALKEYKKLLLQNCIIDFVYNLSHFFTRAVSSLKILSQALIFAHFLVFPASELYGNRENEQNRLKRLL